MQIVHALMNGPMGFNELARAIGGCNPSTLAQRLDTLVKLDLLARRVEASVAAPHALLPDPRWRRTPARGLRHRAMGTTPPSQGSRPVRPPGGPCRQGVSRIMTSPVLHPRSAHGPVRAGARRRGHAVAGRTGPGDATPRLPTPDSQLPTPEPLTYLFSYFTGNGEDGLHFARSEDGTRWRRVADGRSFLAPAVGTKLMRDPSVTRGPDGQYHLVWTTGWWDHGFGVAHSSDLKAWSRQAFVPVLEDTPGVQNVWAPEIHYDAACRGVPRGVGVHHP